MAGKEGLTVTITVDIRPEVQAELARQAAAHGRAVEAYAASLLEEAVHLPSDTSRPAFDKERAQAAGVNLVERNNGSI
jgi:plasmid stability protein